MQAERQLRKEYGFGILITLAGAILFSTKAIFVKLAYRDSNVDAVTLLALRMAFAAPVYLFVAWFYKSGKVLRSLTTKQKAAVFILGLTGYYISSLCDFIGLQYMTASLERLILFLYPSFTVLLSAFFLKEKVRKVQVIALLLTYTGIGLGCISELNLDIELHRFFIGLFFLVMCAFSFALYLVGAGKIMKRTGATSFTTLAMLSATTGILLHYLFKGDHHTVLTGRLLGYGLLLGIVATAIPSFMISRGLRAIGAGNAAIVASIGPVATIIQAHYYLGEKIFVLQLLGTVLVIAGIILISRRPKEIDLPE